ncbi:MAG: MGMT family protein [Proteobacteria bacterium]|nr:MGMT family protein [Pseudomonadota bacterium]MBU4469177.1 MGMT family protein [Pseudomonadota bacterium]MCG2752208.1 MGMT family protein [Desulfobacteraceae bacterium]
MPNAFHHIFPTAYGYCAVLFQDQPLRLMETLLPVSDKKLLTPRIPTHSRETQTPGSEILAFVNAIRDYFLGNPLKISFEELDLAPYTLLQKKVLQAVFEIPFGETRSYGNIAKSIGNPGAARFVGTTMAKNPFPILIPCHRVIKSDGTLGQFGGGSELKAKMLQLEGRP